jgi:hypothetical protein
MTPYAAIQVINLSPTAVIQSAGAHVVEAWFSARLPFEPRGRMLEARNQLQHQLKGLMGDLDSRLDATLSTRKRAFFDLENLLLYNVGPASFRRAARWNLRFARTAAPIPIAPISGEWRYYHRYEVVEQASEPSNAFNPCLQFHFAMKRLNSTTKTHDVWYSARKGLTAAKRLPGCLSGEFALSLIIGGPRYPTNPVALVKPLLDGIASALHIDLNIGDRTSVYRTLADVLKVSTLDIRSMLLESPCPVLGSRRSLVLPRATGLQWNPADERCTWCAVRWGIVQQAHWDVQVKVGQVAS